MTEEPLLFGAGDGLVGVLSLPAAGVDPERPALLLLNAGLVHRVGPHRLYVQAARRLAEDGFVCLRFDFSGIGDSLPRGDHLPYRQSTLAETRAAMDLLAERHGCRSFCLAGLSSGALVSMATALADRRVVGAALLNPHGFEDSAEFESHIAQTSQARIYAGNLRKLRSWQRLVTGQTDYRRLGRSLLHRLRGGAGGSASAVTDEARAQLQGFFALPIRILLLLSEQDRSLDNFAEILGRQWRQRLGPQVETALIADANHTFAGPVHLGAAVDALQAWMRAGWCPQAAQS